MQKTKSGSGLLLKCFDYLLHNRASIEMAHSYSAIEMPNSPTDNVPLFFPRLMRYSRNIISA